MNDRKCARRGESYISCTSEYPCVFWLALKKPAKAHLGYSITNLYFGCRDI